MAHSKATPVSSLDAQRRRSAPVSDAQLLQRLLVAHGEIVGAGLDLQRVVSVVTQRAQDLTNSSGAVVELCDGDELVYWAASGSVEPMLGLRVSAQASLSGQAVREGRVLVCEDSETDPRVDRDACRKVGLRSMVVAPLPYGDSVVGVLMVVSPWVRSYGPNDVRTLELLNTLIGAAMANAAQHADGVPVGKPSGANVLARQISRERIRRVLRSGEFGPVLQPIVDIRNGRIVGYESLTRFHAPPPRSPDKWFAEAARANLGVELELAAAHKALDCIARLPEDVYLSINVSPSTVQHAELERLCRQYPGQRIVLEITEHTRVDDYDALTASTERLRAQQIRFAIDDAGAGFSSLRHILRLKPDFIKLDLSLTHGIDTSVGHQSMVAALLTFAAGTSSTLVAEGVETAAELAKLLEIGVAFGQGWHLGMPAALDSI